MSKEGEIVLITGGSGFLGQHLVRLIEERDAVVKEIRIVDLKPYENRLRHSSNKKLVSYVGDICQPSTIEHAFAGVDCVFHLAAYINFQYPPNLDELERVNVNGTENVIKMCVKFNVSRLVYTSTALVNLIYYMNKGTFSIIVNQTECKAKTPPSDRGFIFPGFAASKLRAEKLVLQSYGVKLDNGEVLKTVALRPPILYGPEDRRFFTRIMSVGERYNGVIPRVCGAGGKQQICYVGNVAWAHLCAKNKLSTDPKKIGGHEIFVTDETPVLDTLRFCQRVSLELENIKLKPSTWYIPSLIAYFLAFLLELLVNLVNYVYRFQLDISPRALVSYGSSVILFDRLRASIHLDYEPIYTSNKAITESAKWYDMWFQEYKASRASKKEKFY